MRDQHLELQHYLKCPASNKMYKACKEIEKCDPDIGIKGGNKNCGSKEMSD